MRWFILLFGLAVALAFIPVADARAEGGRGPDASERRPGGESRWTDERYDDEDDWTNPASDAPTPPPLPPSAAEYTRRRPGDLREFEPESASGENAVFIVLLLLVVGGAVAVILIVTMRKPKQPMYDEEEEDEEGYGGRGGRYGGGARRAGGARRPGGARAGRARKPIGSPRAGGSGGGRYASRRAGRRRGGRTRFTGGSGSSKMRLS